MLYIANGSSSVTLTEDICDHISYFTSTKISPIEILSTRFSDGETQIELHENLRRKNVFVIQSLSKPVNDNLMELVLILDALKRSDVNSVTVIVPYFGYARQDKKVKPRVPISAKVIADILETQKINRIITIDLHSPQIQGFFNIPVDNLYASAIFLPQFNIQKETVIVSPDSGGIERARMYSKRLECPLAFCYKHRDKPNGIDEMKLIGDVNGKNCILIDDMIDTAGTLCEASKILLENGATSVEVYATHAVLSGKAVERLLSSDIKRINITDTIQPDVNVLKENKFTIISVSELLALAILKINQGDSVSKLFL